MRLALLGAALAIATLVTASVVGLDTSAQAQPTKTIQVFVLSGQSNAVGIPAEELEQRLEQSIGADTEHRETVVFKAAYSGTSIYVDWQPDGTADSTDDGPTYLAFQDAYDDFMAGLVAANPGAEIVIPALFWNQGERDARLGHGDVYEDQLNLMIADFRATLDAPDMVVFISRIKGINNYVDNDLVRAGQNAVGASDPSAFTIDVDDVEPFDGLHWGRAGFLALAARYAGIYGDLDHYGWPECGEPLMSIDDCVALSLGDVDCDSVIDADDVDVLLGVLLDPVNASGGCATPEIRDANCDMVAGQGCALHDALHLARCLADVEADGCAQNPT